MPESSDSARLAVLIDADNASADNVDRLFAEIAKYGTATVRRAYGDWGSTHLKKWRDILVENSIQPMQQFAYTKGKNATDIALVIDAMDLLHAGSLDGFCLVSSDSDFTRLAARLREDGVAVYGFGQKSTAQSFIAACSTFIYVENLEPESSQPAKKDVAELKEDERLTTLLRGAVEKASGDDGWANLAAVGSNLSRLASDFDSRTWGYGKLTDLMRAHPDYQVDSRPAGDGKSSNAYVRRA